jgi:very-short-patch-repair endonuclease
LLASCDALTRRAVVAACGQGFVLTRRQALDSGLAPADIRRMVRRSWSAPQRAVVAVLRPQDCDDWYVLMACAAAVRLHRDAVISGQSAGLLHGLPILGSSPMATVTVPVSMPPRPSTPTVGGARLRRAAVCARDRSTWFGVSVTSPARTVIDLGRRDVRDGLVAADAALAAGLVTRGELHNVLGRCTGWPGTRGARRAVELADGAAESALESLTRLCVLDGGLPTPELQVVVSDGAWWCRVDMMWREGRLVLEADGMAKYRTIGDIRDEKRRQERLERLGYRVLRVMWDDVMRRPDETVARIRAALSRV